MGITNPNMQSLIEELRKSGSDVALWSSVARNLSKPSRQRRIVNVSRLNHFTAEDEVVVVPGKVLGSGELKHKLTVAAWDFSKSARERIEQAKGTCLSIDELMKKSPEGKKIRIIG